VAERYSNDMAADDNRTEPSGPQAERRADRRAWLAALVGVVGLVLALTAALLFVLR